MGIKRETTKNERTSLHIHEVLISIKMAVNTLIHCMWASSFVVIVLELFGQVTDDYFIGVGRPLGPMKMLMATTLINVPIVISHYILKVLKQAMLTMDFLYVTDKMVVGAVETGTHTMDISCNSAASSKDKEAASLDVDYIDGPGLLLETVLVGIGLFGLVCYITAVYRTFESMSLEIIAVAMQFIISSVVIVVMMLISRSGHRSKGEE